MKISAKRNWYQEIVSHEPLIYSSLSKEDYQNIQVWYDETENYIGECQVPFMSTLLGFIDGNRIGNIVQLGHYAGYSTIILAMHLKRMGLKNSFITTDIFKEGCDLLDNFLVRFNLTDYAKVFNYDSLVFGDIAVKELPKIDMVIIDSSHQYEQTLKEIGIYCNLLSQGGFIFLHDSSEFAQQWDSTKKGGVLRALNECGLPHINIKGGVYLDSCGICIIQKA